MATRLTRYKSSLLSRTQRVREAVKCVKSLNLKHRSVVCAGLQRGEIHKKQQEARKIRDR